MSISAPAGKFSGRRMIFLATGKVMVSFSEGLTFSGKIFGTAFLLPVRPARPEEWHRERISREQFQYTPPAFIKEYHFLSPGMKGFANLSMSCCSVC
jgi:hypothetical protein